MAVESYNNYTNTTLNDSGGISDSDTSFTVTDGSTFPSSNFRILMESELMFVGSRTGNTFSSVTRGAEGTSNVAHADAITVHHLLTKGAFDTVRANIEQVGTYANLPSAAPQEGDIYRQSDGPVAWRYTGALWAPYGPIFPLTEATDDTGFSWANQGTAAIDKTKGGVIMTTPAAGANHWRVRYKTDTAGAYTVTVLLRQVLPIGDSTIQCGVGFRENSTGKLKVVAISGDGLRVQFWTNPTTFTTNHLANTDFTIHQAFLRIEDDTTNRKYYISQDNENFVQLYTELRSADFTHDEVWWGAFNSNTTLTGAAWLLSWLEA
jgi:hypothetical protein